MPEGPDFRSQWRDRLASGSRMVSKALANAMKEDAGRVDDVVALVADENPIVRIATLRAIAEHAKHDARSVAPHAGVIVGALGAAEPDAQVAALAALAEVAPHARAEMALALPLMSELLAAPRPGLRAEAARCLGRLGAEDPQAAPQAASQLGRALDHARKPRAAQEAREILGALEHVLPHLNRTDRLALAGTIAPLRGHPNIQVRERAGRIARQLSA